ncbi:hypothetical protein NC651_014627 [Populus alba x Populus x berolinensis]|nr:hypothetical protein NC651_014627 [Populus alba x Populus x berolinensis]
MTSIAMEFTAFKEIVNGNESLPYLPIDDHVDPNQSRKTIASEAECSSFKKIVLWAVWEEQRKTSLNICDSHLLLSMDWAKKGAFQGSYPLPRSPINSFESLQPLLRRLGYDVPKDSLSVPRALMLE